MTLGPRTDEPAALGDALDRLEPRLDAGQQPADACPAGWPAGRLQASTGEHSVAP